jgi:hypothetical protein
MNIKKSKLRLVSDICINLSVGLLLLIMGILTRVMELHWLENPKAIIGLSFIPLALAASKLFQLSRIKKHASEMEPLLISENDERLVAQRNEAEATSGKILRYLLYLLFLGYTLSTPSAVFDDAGWWMVFGLFFLSQTLPALFLTIASVKERKASE